MTVLGFNFGGLNMRLHLDFRSSKDKDESKRCYYLAKSYRDADNVSRKNRIEKLGRLTETEYKKWKLKLNFFNAENLDDICNLNELQIFSSRRYLDVAVMSAIYDKLNINDAFIYVAPSKEISTAETAKTLALSRCLDPQANCRTVPWFKESFLPEIMKVKSKERYNKDKIFRELPLINKRKGHLQNLFYKNAVKLNDSDVKLYFFDGTTSYFEGCKCALSRPGKDKTIGYQDNVILICLMTDRNGYPIAWDVAEGNKRDISEFEKIAKKMAKDLNIEEVTYCFDRGVASSDNFKLIEDVLNSKYISGLDSDQISKVLKLDLFVKNTRPKLIKNSNETNSDVIKTKVKRSSINGFYKLGQNRYYTDLGIDSKNKKLRNILSFSVKIYQKQKKTRENLISIVLENIDQLNIELKNAKKDRDGDVLAKKLDQLVGKYRLQKIVNYSIKPIVVYAGAKQRAVQSYEISTTIDEDEKYNAEKVDGILVYVTNHTESKNGQFNVHAHSIVQHYKDKYIIENAFRHLKSFIDLRPFYVWLEDHVRAHVDVCMSSYFVNHYITLKLAPLGISINDFYSMLEKYAYVITVGTTEAQRNILTKTPKALYNILKELGVEKVVSKKVLKSFNIQS